MSRYQTSKQLKNQKGKRRFSTVIVPPVPKTDLDTYIEVTSADRLDKLAYEFYGDASLWWVIASSNELGKGTLIVEQNQILRIPSVTTIQDLISNTNKER
jgi:nucleoid-associated protein YgaU